MIKQLRRMTVSFIVGVLVGILIVRLLPMVPMNSHAIKEQLVNVAKMTTVEYRFEQLVELDDHFSLTLLGKELPLPGTGKQVATLIVGQITAGIDLEKISADDITLGGDRVELKLPSGELFSIEVDYKETKVYDEKTGLFRRIWDDNQMEFANLIIDKGCQEGRVRALQTGLLDVAEENGRRMIRQILLELGFREVIFL